MWGYFKDGVVNAFDDVCGKKMGRRSKGDTEEVKEVVSRMKDAHKGMYQNSIEESKIGIKHEK